MKQSHLKELLENEQYLNQAERIAKDNNLGRLVQKIQDQVRILNAELDKWHDLTRRNAPLQDRLEQVKLEEYLKEARKIIGYTFY